MEEDGARQGRQQEADQCEEMETSKKWTISKESRSTEQVQGPLFSQNQVRPCALLHGARQEVRKRRQGKRTGEPGSAGAEQSNAQDWRHAPREGATVL